MKLKERYLIFLALIFVGITIIYHATLVDKNSNDLSLENFNLNNSNSEDLIPSLNSKIVDLELKINSLEDGMKEISKNDENLIVGGGYVHIQDDDKRECYSWGLANCSQNGNIFIFNCPEGYTPFSLWNREETPISDSEVESLILCIGEIKSQLNK